MNVNETEKAEVTKKTSANAEPKQQKIAETSELISESASPAKQVTKVEESESITLTAQSEKDVTQNSAEVKPEVEVKNESTGAEKSNTVKADNTQQPSAEKPKVEQKKKTKAKLPSKKLTQRKQSHASSGMVKTETINTISELPTAFADSKDRLTHNLSGKAAMIDDVSSRSSCGPTKP